MPHDYNKNEKKKQARFCSFSNLQWLLATENTIHDHSKVSKLKSTSICKWHHKTLSMEFSDLFIK